MLMNWRLGETQVQREECLAALDRTELFSFNIVRDQASRVALDAVIPHPPSTVRWATSRQLHPPGYGAMPRNGRRGRRRPSRPPSQRTLVKMATVFDKNQVGLRKGRLLITLLEAQEVC